MNLIVFSLAALLCQQCYGLFCIKIASTTKLTYNSTKNLYQLPTISKLTKCPGDIVIRENRNECLFILQGLPGRSTCFYEADQNIVSNVSVPQYRAQTEL